MAYSVRDALKFTYVLVSQHWASRAIGSNNFLFALNSALNMVYNYNGYIRTRQHRKAMFTNVTTSIVRLITDSPINTIDKFWTSQWSDMEWTVEPCTCPDLEDDIRCECQCTCGYECKPLQLTHILPQNRLCPNEYQIAGSEIRGMWGLGWRIVRAKLSCPTDVLWMTYYAAPKHCTSFDDIVPLPDMFMTALSYFVAAQIVPLYGIMMQQQDLNFLTLARKELDSLKMADNIFPQKTQRSDNYPIFWNQTVNTVGMWTQIINP